MSKKLVWLDINCSYAHSSLALPAIHAQRNTSDGFEWDVVTATNSTNMGTVVENIVAKAPDVVAATAWLFTHEYLLRIVSRVKALLPECIVIMGGPEFLGCNEEYLRCHPEINCAARGEGENVFHEWLAVVDNEEKWKVIPGLCFIGTDGKYHDAGIAKVADFASLNPPESSAFFSWQKPFVQLETTRGCFNGCAFCVSGSEKPVRSTPLEKVRERVENIHAHGIREIRLLDRTFNGNSQRAAGMLEIFAGFPEMRFHLEIHPALLNEGIREMIRLLPSGILHLEAGIQSLHAPVLKACKRAGGVEESLDGLRFLCGLGNTITHTDLIAGLPLYTLRQIYDDISALAGYGAAEIQLELLKLLPGTEMREKAEVYGIRYSPSPPYEVLMTAEMTVAEIQTARLLSRLLDMYYNARAWHGITCRLITGTSHFLPGFLSELRRGDYLDQPLSVAKRGLLLYGYIKENLPAYEEEFTNGWVEAGLSLRKLSSRD